MYIMLYPNLMGYREYVCIVIGFSLFLHRNVI